MRMSFAVLSAVLMVPMSAFAQSSTGYEVKTYVSGGSRSEAAAIASILSRRSPDEARVIARALQALENGSERGTFGRNTGEMATEQVLLNTLEGSDNQTLRSAYNSMIDFDKGSLLTLVRDAYFGGIYDAADGGSRPLRFEGSGEGVMQIAEWSGATMVMSPEYRIVDNLASKMGDQGDVWRRALATIESENAERNYSNLGYVNAQEVLVNAIAEGDRSAFTSMWQSMDYGDKEAALSIVRDALFGGIADL